MRYKVGIDVGGTFTDFLVTDQSGRAEVFKVLSTPKDPSKGVFNGLQEIAAAKDLAISDFLKLVEIIVHGTTITTNAALTGTGAKTGFVTTKGFRDVLNMRRGLKENQYETKCGPPLPLVPRKLIRVVEERVDCEGNELVPVNFDDVKQAIDVFKKEEVESVGISLMFSFFNSDHEKTIKKMLEEALEDVYISVSSEILPQVRFYERNSTVALNAYVGPKLKNYLINLLQKLKSNGFKGSLLIMQSNGGVMSPEVAMRFASNTLLSGPAGGPTAGLYYGKVHGIDNIITVDMGGTSFDACLVKNGNPTVTVEASIARHRLASPIIDIHTIGAGGGSIAWIDHGGLLQVGPQSAGADPGPICYGLGGTEPTVTDADLLLGYLDPDYFHGGKIKLDLEKAKNIMREKIADKLGMTVTEAANGIYRIINSHMAAGLRVVSVARGFDPRDFALICAGGAGPIHAGMIARELEIPLIIIPKASSVFCAAGMLMTDLRHDYVRTYATPVNQVDFDKVNSLFNEMKEEALKTLAREGIPEDMIVINYSVDLRYEGQFNEVEVNLIEKSQQEGVSSSILSMAIGEFHKKHDSLYGYSLAGAPTELINLRVTARGITEKPSYNKSNYMGHDPSPAFKNNRKAFFGKEFIEVPVYDGLLMGYGNVVKGPAIVEDPTTTIVVTEQHDLTCDEYDNFIMFRKGISVIDVIEKLRRG